MTRILIVLAVLVLAVLLFRWWSAGGEREAPADVVAALADGAQVLDVRTPGEFASGHVAGAANADVLGSDFEAQVADLDRDRPVYVYCASGHRSGRAASVMDDMGFTRVVNAGGFSSLTQAGAPTER